MVLMISEHLNNTATVEQHELQVSSCILATKPHHHIREKNSSSCLDNISMNVAPFPEKHAKLMISVIAPNMILQVYLEPNVASTAIAKPEPCELRGKGHDAHGLATFPRLLSVAVEQHGSPARGLPIQQLSQIIVWWHSA